MRNLNRNTEVHATPRDSVAWRWAELVGEAAFLRAQVSPVRVPLNDMGSGKPLPPEAQVVV